MVADNPRRGRALIRPVPAAQTRALRHRVLRPTQAIEETDYPGDDLPDTLHLGAFDGDRLVGIASVYRESRPGRPGVGWRLRGMATEPDVRGAGFGSALVAACVTHVAASAGDEVWCNARASAVGFYRRGGFVVVSDEFDVADLGPHFVMARPVEPDAGAGAGAGAPAGEDGWAPRQATADDSDDVARLLHDFNTEFDCASPGPDVLAARLRVLLAGQDTFAILAGSPGVAVALVTLRPNVWFAGRVALLDELYVVSHLRGRGIGSSIVDRLLSMAQAMDVDLIEINVDEGDVDAQRFYERHGFSPTEPGSTERAFYYSRELTS